jgi:hypothetical protein
MIGRVLVFLRGRLNDYLRAELGGGIDDPAVDKVVFLDGDKMEPLTFQEGAVSEVLINVEEDRLLRAADPYARATEDGRPLRVQPDIRLSLHLLFIARFKQYDRAWDHLAKIIECLQTTRVFDRASSPDLPDGVDRLTVELVTQGFAEQNDVWNALRTTYHPSIAYRVRMVVLRDAKPATQDQVTQPVAVIVRKAT